LVLIVININREVRMGPEREYSMANRSVAAARTRENILGATMALSAEKLTVEIVLADVAARAGVTVQTVLRHFGSRDGLFDAVVEFVTNDVVTEREAPVGDVESAIGIIVDHYESRGDWVIALLGQETTDGRVRGVTDIGKRVHREWVDAVFGPLLVDRRDREVGCDLLGVATDVYTWKILRRDRGLSRAQTEHRMLTLVDAILASPSERN
jgi:AcrR family transcriptional regulator